MSPGADADAALMCARSGSKRDRKRTERGQQWRSAMQAEVSTDSIAGADLRPEPSSSALHAEASTPLVSPAPKQGRGAVAGLPAALPASRHPDPRSRYARRALGDVTNDQQ